MRQPTGYYHELPNVIYRDSYDNSFLKYATLFWLFHHWGNVDHSRFDQDRIQDLESKFRALQAQGYRPDPDYEQPGIDPDLTYRRDVAYQNPALGSLAPALWALIPLGLAGWLAWFIFIRRVPYPQA